MPSLQLTLFGNHHVGAKILFYARQTVVSLEFFKDSPKEITTTDVFSRQTASIKVSKDIFKFGSLLSCLQTQCLFIPLVEFGALKKKPE